MHIYSNSCELCMGLLLLIGKDGQPHIYIDKKRYDFNFILVYHKRSVLDKQYSIFTHLAFFFLSHSLYSIARLAPYIDVLFYDLHNVQILAFETETRQGTLKIVTEEALWSILESYQTL